MKRVFAVLFSLLILIGANAKEIRGTVKDAQNREPLVGATVGVINSRDTSKIYYNITDLEGRFALRNIPEGRYRIEVSFIGFTKYTKAIQMKNEPLNLGSIALKEETVKLGEATVQGRAIRATQMGDTVSYNADAFKTIQGSNAEDMLAKMPGVVVQNGQIQAQGEQVKKVMVDGKEFFEGDPTTALRNLPTEVIQSIEIFDRQSEQSQFTGFNDGNTTKTINVVTRNRKVQGSFGKFSGGYGTDNRYNLSGNYNLFSGDQRISILAMSNNVNQQNFSQDDLMGAMGGASRGMGGGRHGGGRRPMSGGFGGGSNYGIGQLSGVTQTHAAGLNYTNNWNNKLTLSGSYFITSSDNDANQAVNRQYFDEASGIRKYMEATLSNNKSANHRFNARMEWTIDDKNALLFYPSFNIQNSNSLYNLSGKTSLSDVVQNSTVNSTNSDGNAFSGGAMLMYRHKFEKVGRTISIGGNGRYSPSYSGSWQEAQNSFFTGSGQDTSYVQRIDNNSPGYSIGGMSTYTEPLNKNSQLMVSYNINYSYTDKDKQTFNVLPTAENQELIEALSSKYNNGYLTNSLGVGYRLNGEKLSLTGNLNFQNASLNGDIIYPKHNTTSRTFNNILPMLMMDYKATSENRFRLFLRTSTNSPSITQLQEVVDNSNPLFLSTGNPNLGQEVNTMAHLRYTYTNKGGQTFVAMVGGSNRMNYVGDSTFVADRDQTINGVLVKKGAQFSSPKNMDGYWSANSMFTFGFPMIPIKSNVNINLGINYNRLPGIYNGMEQITNNWTINPGIVISSNISDRMDFTLSYNASYNDAKNNLLPNANTTYLNQRGNFKFSWIFWKGFTFENNLSFSAYNGMSGSAYDQAYFLWNASVGKKFLKDNRGEIKLSVFDMLQQNKSINRNVTTTYFEDVIANVMPRYYMVSFTYQLRKINGAVSNNQRPPSGNQGGERHGPPHGMM